MPFSVIICRICSFAAGIIILLFDKICHILILAKKELFFTKDTNYFTLPGCVAYCLSGTTDSSPYYQKRHCSYYSTMVSGQIQKCSMVVKVHRKFLSKSLYENNNRNTNSCCLWDIGFVSVIIAAICFLLIRMGLCYYSGG